MGQQEFYLSHEPEPTTLLGVELRPYALGHVILLHRIDNAFVVGGVPTMSDLVTAVWVCAQSYEDTVEALRTGYTTITTPLLWWRRRRQVSVPEAMAIWQRTVGTFDLSQKCKEFVDYQAAGSKHPIVSSVHGYKESDKPNDCPVVQTVKAFLMSKTSLTEKELLNRSWSLCLWDYCAIRMLGGDLRFVGDEEQTSIQAAQELADHLQSAYDLRESTRRK